MKKKRITVLQSQFADVQGIGDIPLSNDAGVIQTNCCPVFAIFHQYGHYGKAQTIHSPVQLEHFSAHVDDLHSTLSIFTPDGFAVPLKIQQGLDYVDMHP